LDQMVIRSEREFWAKEGVRDIRRDSQGSGLPRGGSPGRRLAFVVDRPQHTVLRVRISESRHVSQAL
jgi:hypothetical protein